MKLPAPRWFSPVVASDGRLPAEWWSAGWIGVFALAVYAVGLWLARSWTMFGPWSADPDQQQAVFQYWRYHIAGAFPSGHLMTDYAFTMHAPPVWWLLMASLSTFVTPLTAAKLLFTLAFFSTVAVVVVGVGRYTRNIFIGLAAGFLLVRNPDFYNMIAGGYARSFGPLLAVAFAGAFLAGRHRLCLVLLVVQAGLYPTVVIACGLAYGAYVVVAGPTMQVRLRRCAGMLVAGLLVIGLGKSQDLLAPRWWGSVVTYAESEKMVAWSRKGRTPDVPMSPPSREMRRNIKRAFRADPPTLSPALTGLWQQAPVLAPLALPLACVAIVAVDRARRRPRPRAGAAEDAAEEDADDGSTQVPWQLALIAAATVVGYFLARALAWKLYFPYRILAHTWPYLLYMGLPMVAWLAARALLGRRVVAATVVAFAVAVVPTFVAAGPGGVRGTYSSTAKSAPMWEVIRKLPLDTVIACDRGMCDRMALYTFHRAYQSRNLTHPFRPGYYREAERRLVTMLDAFYATDLNDVVAFAEAEGVSYFLYEESSFKGVDARLFEPVKGKIEKLFRKRKAQGFALARPPASAVVFQQDGATLIDIARLKAALSTSPQTPPPEPTPTPEPMPPTPAPTEP